MRKYCLAFVALLWAATTWADCNKTTSDYDVVYCGTKLYLQADKELNDVYQKLVGKLNTDGKKLLKTGQLAWIESRNRQCTETRSDSILVDLDCATRTTVERTQFLTDRQRECLSTGCMNSKLR
jgi:uncharacterized protein YecT (DUF1311 family)